MSIDKSFLSRAAFLVWVICAAQTAFVLSDLWPYSKASRLYQHALETLTTFAIVAIAAATWRSLLTHCENRETITCAKLVALGVLFCAFGDLVNFNLFQHGYRYDPLIKHDYLIDSIYVFSIGYGLILLSSYSFLKRLAITHRQIFAVVLMVSSVTLLSYAQMRLPDTAPYVSTLAGFYALLVAQCASVAVLLLLKAAKSGAPKRYYLLVIGLLLATLADALIGQFWLFGNQGQGYFPLIRTVNWFIYISSSLLIIQLPWVFQWLIISERQAVNAQIETLTNG
ncbi:hypothetical protein A7985_12100 [Pseudoalteromonas luteoviolacea]|uniref:Uncharacterized protein n=1 Tax=Pseudoalteromonas luteoviolacea TaxID=43657 RepID=A0A1C0TR84_9GAMM|nr:hypothetical protein [Pseudoalteromonas luteoviolacea]OCQ21355.1 hypothetical protein A7985_12100 [Pseudoalteromonas luteoviolacea]